MRSRATRQLKRYRSRGFALSASVWPATAEPKLRVLALHGFIGSGADFQALVDYSPDCVEWIAPDILGHGDSDAPREVEGYAMDGVSRDILKLLEELDEMPTLLLGYSMGGRLALHTALRNQEKFNALALFSSTAGLIAPSDRERRKKEDASLARFIEGQGLDDFLAHWYEHPIIETQKRIQPLYLGPMRDRRRLNWEHGLANSLRGMGTGSMESLWEELLQLSLPVFLLTGQDDSKYTRLGLMLNLAIPKSTHHNIRHAGHSVHLEAPIQTMRHLQRWIVQLGFILDEERSI